MTAATAPGWKYFPHYLIGAMLVVVAVNVRFIVIAVTTFPGAASTNDFDTSNHYNAILDAVAAQARLGWTAAATAKNGRPALDLAGPGGVPLSGASIHASAERPLGTLPAMALTFREAAPGHYDAAGILPLQGQWDLKLQIDRDNRQLRVTRRILVP